LRAQQAAQKPPILYELGVVKDKTALEPPGELTGIVRHDAGLIPTPQLEARVRAKLPQLAGKLPASSNIIASIRGSWPGS
jgi:hypothetical protein